MTEITWQRPEYDKALPDWQLGDDVCEGERAIKDRGETYLPKPNPHDNSEQNTRRYDQYKARAVFYPATARTNKGLVALVFRKDPVVTLPESLEFLITDVDGKGNSIYQQSQKALSKLLRRGRHGFLVDYPRTGGVVSKAQKEALGIKSRIVGYNADQIVNWDTETQGGKEVLSLLVLRETVTVREGFKQKSITQYRELSLDDGIYTVRIWRKKDKLDEWEAIDEFQPVDGKGQKFSKILFQIIGAENNDSDIDKAPLDEMARLNIAHYRNSADYEDSCFFVGQVQPVMTGLTEEWRDHLEQQGIYAGSRNPIMLPAGGDFKFAQAQPNSLVKEAMDTKERQMVAVGAYLIEKGSAVKTATQQNSEDAVSHSVVSLCAQNLSEAYEQCIKWVAEFENVELGEDFAFLLNTDFTSLAVDAQVMQAIATLQQGGIIAKHDVRAFLRRMTVIDPSRTDEDIEIEAANEMDELPKQEFNNLAFNSEAIN